ncbi:HEAT repeat domain-containing protein [Kitasatospora sp. NPDC057223]|uniref:HEAT repeat domain-containing protein n=1 Tax=Kitasatospora sp. NPDC057223 TaxID=3346055 RepID=UPI0036411AEE
MITARLEADARLARGGHPDAVATLLALLAGASRAAELRPLAERPALLLTLDSIGRRSRREGGSLDRIGAVAALSLDRDGRQRETAVRRIVDLALPELMPFLVLRTADWAAPVRQRARAGLVRLLTETPGRYTSAIAPTALLLARRSRGEFARAQLFATLLTEPRTASEPVRTDGRRAEARVDETGALITELLASPFAGVRVLALRAGIETGRLRARDLIAPAMTDPAPAVRTRAAEAVAREAVWTGRPELLERLLAAKQGSVRVLALTGLLRLGQTERVAERLADPAALVRALAREAARRLGSDPALRYRTLIADDAPSAGAIDSLAELGIPADRPLLAGLLTHPSGPVRARAVRALRLRGSVAPAELVPLLRDPDAGVIREASRALRTDRDRLPEGLALELLADPGRVEVRRAGYRLLPQQDQALRLRAALTLSTDPDSRLAARGAADAAAVAQARARDDALTPHERAELRALLGEEVLATRTRAGLERSLEY